MLGLYISIIVIGVLLLFLLICFLLYFKIFYNERKGTIKEMQPLKGKLYEPFNERSLALIKSSDSIPYQTIEMKVSKRRTLRGKYYFVDEKAPLAIMVHGYKGCGVRDFSGGLQELLKRKSNVLLIDHRGHGRSDGRTITFGVKEKYDVLKWIDFMNEKLNNPDIYLYGISMGAATVLMVSGMNMPKNVKCVIADCPYSSVKQEIKDTVKAMHIPFAPVYPFIYMSALIFAGFDMKKGYVNDYLKNTKVPIMLIHGTTDDIVPVKHSRALKEKYPDLIKYIEVEGAPHGMSYFVDYDRYSSELTNFLDGVSN